MEQFCSFSSVPLYKCENVVARGSENAGVGLTVKTQLLSTITGLQDSQMRMEIVYRLILGLGMICHATIYVHCSFKFVNVNFDWKNKAEHCMIVSLHLSIENSGYILVQSAKNWTDAQSYCRQHYTDLPTIHNSEQNNQINQILLSDYIWIGLFLDSWEWSDKWSLFFRYWAAGQPSMSSGSGDCVGMSTADSGKWFQHRCDLQQPFICHEGEFNI
uniref:C-type lectin domain-containing protein n=1 Tax=Cyprinus carpio TaxID=7962 RepID=A0A8C2PQM3_CYPCA